MKPTIQVHDKHFEVFIEKSVIENRIAALASSINQDYEGKRPLFLAILNGSFMFAAELMKSISVSCEITFLRVSSYQATESSGKVHQILGLLENIEGRDIVVVEDIVDTGLTMIEIKQQLMAQNPASLSVVTLFQKPEALKQPLEVEYVGFEIENKFVLGYGLDYDGLGRNLSDLYVLCPA
ncbi:hypoxanthine phosphoribosyltransferase [Arcicella aurantiaca]|uniref:Hypoxanthine phosphoribosyltransferase n=1 Tax=Arcicella aurantiaca TaxID=591202 RepID=A0A316EZY9_9BACT|nr:hypoxanthine phosphoribosyltransferase [Arcicella aurantiaca]PWK28876.1 hypoxanthine phosphoribosyltransferase [Arcicella aurantiaca]